MEPHPFVRSTLRPELCAGCGLIEFSQLHNPAAITQSEALVEAGQLTPMAIFETIREKAVDMLRLALMGNDQHADEEQINTVLKPILGIGIAAATEHFGHNPEHLALAALPMCLVCHEPIQTLQLGADIAENSDSTVMVKRAWPCGHIQPKGA